MGVPLLLGTDGTPCPLCGDFVDAFGDHLVACRRNGPTERHNAVRDALFAACVQAGVPARKEQGCEGGTRDADILLHAWNKGRPVAVDIVIEHALAPSRWPLNLSRVSAILPDAEATKATRASERCARAGWDFQGAAFSLWGKPGPAASSLIFRLQQVAHNGLHTHEREQSEREFRQNFSLAFVRAVARQLRLACRVQDAVEHSPSGPC